MLLHASPRNTLRMMRCLFATLIVQINAGAEMLEGEEFGDDNFDFDEDADNDDI